MKKSKLRKIYLSKQKSLTEEERSKKDLQIKERFFADFDLDSINIFHVFLAITEKGEIDTSLIIEKLWREFTKIKTVVPRVNFEREVLEHLEFSSKTKMAINHWGINEPVGNELIDERDIDLVLVPLLCFDKKGFRVGYGKGFYDKFLVKCREDCLKVGLSYFEPINEIKNVNKFDIPLDYCITPKRIYSWKE